MLQLYKKSPLWFALGWIFVYVLGSSLADSLSASIGIESSFTAIFHVIFALILVICITKCNLSLGICKPKVNAKAVGFYLPLAVLSSVNLWYGVSFAKPPIELVCAVISMLCVGLIEELLFRGLLFWAIDERKTAVLISALTFGIGHIVNLINGAPLFDSLCQIIYASAIGFIFAIVLLRTGSLIPCIITHSILNAFSPISNSGNPLPATIVLTTTSLAYAWFLYHFPSKIQ